MMMPGMNGIDLARAIKKNEEWLDIRLIMLTSLDGSGELELARQVGISTYLVKPVRQSRLLNALATAMGTEEASMTGSDAPPNRLFTGSSILLVEDHPINQEKGGKSHARTARLFGPSGRKRKIGSRRALPRSL